MSARTVVLLVLGLFLLVLGVAHLVETDEEAIEAAIERAAAAYRTEAWEELRGTLVEEFTAEGRDREGSLDYLRSLKRRYPTASVSVPVGRIEVDGDRAWALITPQAVIAGRRVGRTMALDLVRRDGRWLMVTALPWAGSKWPVHRALEESPANGR